MQGGELDVRISIMRATTAADSFNELIQTWTTLATVWAKAMPASDGEMWRAGRTLADSTMRFTLRSSTMSRSITPSDRIVYENKTYDIEGVKEIGRNAYLEITATAKAA